MTALESSYPYVPRVVAFCDDQTVLGCDFYVMERIPGIILRRELPAGMVLPEEEARRLCTNVLDRLIELHAIDYRQAGLEDFGKPEGYVEPEKRERRDGGNQVFHREAPFAWCHWYCAPCISRSMTGTSGAHRIRARIGPLGT